MSKLQELIKQYCPNGVEYKKLGEIGEFYSGLSGKSKEDFQCGNAKFVTYKNIYSNSQLNMEILEHVRVDDNEKQHQVRKGDILFTGSSETADECGMSSVVAIAVNEKLYLNSFCFGLRLNTPQQFNIHYLKHLLRSNEIRKQIKQTASGVTRYNISKKRFANIEIPVPPLEVQEEIVKILDRFSEYAAELQAELQARREQYEYYRDKLLSFNKIGGVLWLTMNEIGTFIRGNGLQKKDFTESGFPCIHYGQIHTHYGTFANETISFTSQKYAEQLKKAQYGDLIIATTSEDVDGCCKAVAWLGHSEVAISGDAYIFHHKQNPKYISYLFQTDLFANYKRTAYTGTKVIRVSSERMGKFALPIPPLAEQERIVGILDKFETLVNDLSEGLPSEIAAVGEQYEYYRNKLLTFPRA